MMPIALEKFSGYVQEMHKDRDLGFEAEYGVSSTKCLYNFVITHVLYFRPSVINPCLLVMLLKPQ